MWRLNAWPRLIDPLARTLKRFAAPRFVFILGITLLYRYYEGRWQTQPTGRTFVTLQSLGFLILLGTGRVPGYRPGTNIRTTAAPAPPFRRYQEKLLII